MTIGEKLSRLRKEQNYTQEQLADILGVSRQSISKWESDITYPETDKLIKLGKIYNCSLDYLLSEDSSREQTAKPSEDESFVYFLRHPFREHKSKKTIMGMPLYHIGKNACGFFAFGFKAKGVFSFGLLSRGVVSFGILSVGLISLGVLPIGLISAGGISIGILAAGAVALGLVSLGALSIGLLSFGAASVGCFSAGAFSYGKYIAVGDHSYGMISVGKTVAEGTLYSHIGDMTTADVPAVLKSLDKIVPSWLNWLKEIYKFFIF